MGLLLVIGCGKKSDDSQFVTIPPGIMQVTLITDVQISEARAPESDCAPPSGYTDMGSMLECRNVNTGVACDKRRCFYEKTVTLDVNSPSNASVMVVRDIYSLPYDNTYATVPAGYSEIGTVGYYYAGNTVRQQKVSLYKRPLGTVVSGQQILSHLQLAQNGYQSSNLQNLYSAWVYDWNFSAGIPGAPANIGIFWGYLWLK